MISTPRLVLRRFTREDAPAVQRLAGAPEVALNTLLIPHPYPDGEAERWISTHDEAFQRGDMTFAITMAEDQGLVGAIGLHSKPDHDRAEIGYWIGLPFWGKGFATEAASAVLRHWKIESTRDFGAMIFALIDAELLQKQREDRVEDFEGVFDFDDAFDRAYRIPCGKKS